MSAAGKKWRVADSKIKVARIFGSNTRPSPTDRIADVASPDPSAEEDFYEEAYKKRAFRMSAEAVGTPETPPVPDAEEPAAA